ncbi:MAG: Spy/CpxP family protein refolding chaperone [Minwuia sp.]|uniref:Spy/CpxP family protein refolding chaperone n=1 Tax=Minwuia sp. TaxID=2493630 RepID=UPI003A8BD049
MQTRMKILVASGIAALGIAGAAATLSAASPDGFEKARYGGGHHRGMHMICTQGEDRLEDIVTFAEIRLSITDDQQDEWDAFAEAVRTGGQQMLTACDRMETLRTGNAPERLAEVEQVMETALGATKTIRSKFDPLYAVLSDEQKATVERLTHKRHGDGHHRRHKEDGEKDG